VLRQLHISGLGVIDDLDLEFHPGLNVLTGETGAGKTMVAVGLGLALGARAGAQLVRQGAKAARVQARFDAPPEADDWAEDGELILARTVGGDGKSTARIGGQLATASASAGLGAGLVEILGQHQTLALLRPAVQTAFLDRYAGDEHVVALAAYREVFERLEHATAELGSLEAAARDRDRELDLLRYQISEIEGVAPVVGETEALTAEESRLGHVERLLELGSSAQDTLGEDGGILDATAAAAVAMQHAAELDGGAEGIASRASGLAAELAELTRDIRDYRESLSIDPTRLQLVRERLATLRSLRRKYGASEHEVIGFAADASRRVAALTNADERIDELRADVAELTARAGERAAAVGAGRRAAAPALGRAIESELSDLGMPGARLQVRLVPVDPPGATGTERAELLVATGPGQDMVSVAKQASGGELSRIMLACRSVLADLDDVPTLVFDEVDAGIGGQAGLAVGRRLARLAQDRQVLVVTHLPQIACFADRHVRVRKVEGAADVEVLDDDDRVIELSRMLAGLEASAHGASHAQELIAEAARIRSGVA